MSNILSALCNIYHRLLLYLWLHLALDKFLELMLQVFNWVEVWTLKGCPPPIDPCPQESRVCGEMCASGRCLVMPPQNMNLEQMLGARERSNIKRNIRISTECYVMMYYHVYRWTNMTKQRLHGTLLGSKFNSNSYNNNTHNIIMIMYNNNLNIKTFLQVLSMYREHT
jgi:hypothetical protein